MPHQSGIKKHKIMILGAHTFYSTERRLNFAEKMNTGCITVFSFQKSGPKACIEVFPSKKVFQVKEIFIPEMLGIDQLST